VTSSSKDADDDRVATLLERAKAEAMRAAVRDQRVPNSQREADQNGASAGSSADQSDDKSNDLAVTSRTPPELRGFRIIREIGRGGMGVVYEAEEEVLGRRVALKVLPSTADPDHRKVERFKREARAAAKLHHTNIVPVFGVGQQGDQRFLVMQYIEGQGLDAVIRELRHLKKPVAEHIRAETISTSDEARRSEISEEPDVRLSISNTAAEIAGSIAIGRFGSEIGPAVAESADELESDRTRVTPPPHVPTERLRRASADGSLSHSSELSARSDFTRPYFQCVARIGRQVANALDYAHRQGVLHRDIKPSNLLVDAQGIVWVTDFGLAKTSESDGLTDTGELLGTVRYLAPERFEGRGDARSDVYCLGLTLYELVALRPAFAGTDRYRVMQAIQKKGPEPLRKLNTKVPPDLDTIIQKAIAREPGRRYASARAMADDLGRFLEGRTILARRASIPGRAARWCRRNPWIAASMFTLASGIGISTWQAFRATNAERAARIAEESIRAERNRAKSQAQMFAAVNAFLNRDLLAQASPDNQARPGRKPDPDLKVRTALERASESIGVRFAEQPVVEAAIRQTIAETYFQLGLYQQSLLHARRALELRQSALGDHDPETLKSKLLVGTIDLSDGKLSEAEPVLVEVLHELQAVPDTERLVLLDATYGVGQLYLAQGKHAEAERVLIQVRDGYARTADATPLQKLSALNTLAMVYEGQKKSEEAKRLLAAVVRDARLVLGREHPLTLGAMNNMATVLASLGSNTEAMNLLEDALEAKRSVLGNKHPDTLYAMVTLAESYTTADRLDQAEALLLEALAGCRTALDRNHETTDAALAMLAAVYAQKRDLQKLGPVLLEAVEITRSRYGNDHELTASGNLAAAKFFLAQQNFAGAEQCFRERLAYFNKKSPHDWDRFVAAGDLGACLIALKKYDEAETLLSAAFDGMKTLGSRQRFTNTTELRATLELAIRLYGSAGRKDTAANWQRKLAELPPDSDLRSKK
jgi:serine/threonine protein kinase